MSIWIDISLKQPDPLVPLFYLDEKLLPHTGYVYLHEGDLWQGIDIQTEEIGIIKYYIPVPKLLERKD